MRKTASVGLSLLVVIGFVACSGSANSPTSPSALPFGGATTITGTAQTTGTAALSFGQLAHTDSDGPLEVCVVGTDVCAVVDASGHFELVGNFVGDIQLQFSSGADHNVMVTVHDVQLGQTITVTVSLNGESGTVVVESREGGASAEDADDTERVRLCHLEGDGDYHPIEVSVSAEEDHLAHGDGFPGGDVPGTDEELRFDDNCDVTDAETEDPEEEPEEEEKDETDPEGDEEDEEDNEAKVPVCHLTGNGSYRLIEVSINAVQAHMDHGDMEPMDGSCSRDGVL